MTLNEQAFADLYREYLSLDHAAIVQALGGAWPSLSDAVRLCPHDDAELSLPCLAIVAIERPGRHPLLMEMTVFIRVEIELRIAATETDEERAGTPTELAQSWVQGINNVLRYDGEEDGMTSLRQHILSLPEEQRTQGEILLRNFAYGIEHEINSEDRTAMWEIRIDHKVNMSPPD